MGEANGIYRFWVLFVALGAGVPSPLVRNATLPRYRMPGVPCNARHRCRHCRLAVLGGHAPGAWRRSCGRTNASAFRCLFGLEVDNPDADYNIRHAKTAIGSGGWTGMGWRNGPMTGYGFVPEQETDFIFCTWSEEWGLFGAFHHSFSCCSAGFILRILFLAERQRSAFTSVCTPTAWAASSSCTCSSMWAWCLGLAPVIGIPLPFMSYGGSSFMAFALMVAILVRLDAERFSVLR